MKTIGSKKDESPADLIDARIKVLDLAMGSGYQTDANAPRFIAIVRRKRKNRRRTRPWLNLRKLG